MIVVYVLSGRGRMHSLVGATEWMNGIELISYSEQLPAHFLLYICYE